MGQFLVIDHEEKTSELIKASIKSLDERALIVSSTSLSQWRKDNAAGDKMQFDIVILDFPEFSPAQWLKELETFKTEVSLNENMKIIMIGYEEPGLDRKKLIKLDIFNFVFKPFDELILKETINSATLASKRQTSIEIKSQKSSATVGILKDIEMQSLSELGFVTLSEEQIPPLSISKYFSLIFSRGVKQSIWAQLIRSIPHPHKEKTFINQFQFIAPDTAFLTALRKYIKDHKLDATANALWSPAPPKEPDLIKIAMIGHDDAVSQKLKADLQTHFANVECELVTLNQKALEHGLLPHKVVINLSEIGPEAILKYFNPQTKIFLIRGAPTSDDDLKEAAIGYTDIFITPLDRMYFYKKLRAQLAGLAEKEDKKLVNIACHEKMKVANLLKISDISEVFISFNYHRELSLRTWREFTLIAEDERNMVELQAFCNFVEKSPNDKSKFFHQFAFFGMTDHYLKAIRLWLVQNYLSQKKNEN